MKDVPAIFYGMLVTPVFYDLGYQQRGRIFQRTCQVEMRGCMASVRHNERFGRVLAIRMNKDWKYLPHYPERECALLIRQDNGEENWLPAAAFWENDKGILEWQQ